MLNISRVYSGSLHPPRVYFDRLNSLPKIMFKIEKVHIHDGNISFVTTEMSTEIKLIKQMNELNIQQVAQLHGAIVKREVSAIDKFTKECQILQKVWTRLNTLILWPSCIPDTCNSVS